MSASDSTSKSGVVLAVRDESISSPEGETRLMDLAGSVKVVDSVQTALKRGIGHHPALVLVSAAKLEAEIHRLNAALEERVRERTKDLTRANTELQERTMELEAFNKAMIGREKRVIELKEEINRLCARLSEPPAYPPVWRERPH